MLDKFLELSHIMQTFLATGFTWFVTALGAGSIFFFRKLNRKYLDISLGFAGGVMVAASYWSLLSPSIELSKTGVLPKWIPPSVGFILGALFLFFLDKIIPHVHVNSIEKEGVNTSFKKNTLLILAITLHNIPEGLAIGVAFGAVASGVEGADIFGAISLAIGIGLQNFPEGFAVSMPLRMSGKSRFKSFFYGQMSAIVEPIFGILGALAVSVFTPILPYALAFAAGAMIFVVVEEVIPEFQRDKYTDIATLSFILGFVIMMILDVSLG